MTEPAENLAQHLAVVRDRKRKNDWDAIHALGRHLPSPLTKDALPLAGEVAFALGRVRRHGEAIAIEREAYALEPTWRRASALAYLHYDAAIADGRGVPKGAKPLSRNDARDGFREWIELALRHRPDSIKDLYRLGVFEAQVESCHDKPALRAFLAAIERYRALPESERRNRGDLHRAYVKSLYAGARSALRLGRTRLARRLAFACVRQDATTDHIDPVHRLDMAGRVCLATGELDHAERALRLALDAKGPPRRAHIYVRLSEVFRRRGDFDAACRWIEGHLRPERRPAYVWRQLGDLHREAGRPDDALTCWLASVDKDRGGKHLTWTRIADLHAERGDFRRAERTYRKAIDYARRQWSKEHRPAIEALAKLYRERGKPELADKVLAPLAKAWPAEHARHANASGAAR